MFTHWKRYACAYVSGVAEGLAAIGFQLRPRKPKTTDENQW